MLLSAMTGFAAAVASGSVLVGFAAAIAVSVAIAAIVAFSGIELRLNQIAVGFVLFLLARQLALFLGDSYVGRAGPKVPAWDIPLLSEIPFFGTVLFSHNLSVYGAYLVVGLSYGFIYFTRPGLVLRGKPAPDIFLLAAERLAQPPAACIVLEDSEPGVRGDTATGGTKP